MEYMIPKKENPERYERNSFKEEPFVEICSLLGLDVCMKYPRMNMQYAEERCLVRKEVYEKLLEAQEYLPQGYYLRIWDAWRPFALQKELYDLYEGNIIRQFFLENVSKKKKKIIISQYISEPIKNRICPPVHTTGGAVDVTLINDMGEEYNMGSEFDSFSEKAHTAYYEGNGDNKEVVINRRILYYAMSRAGFTNLPSEWWHYDYGNRFWAYYEQKPAIYKGVFTLEEVNRSERREQKTKIEGGIGK